MGSRKPLLCILSYEKTGCKGGGDINVSLNPGASVVQWLARMSTNPLA